VNISIDGGVNSVVGRGIAIHTMADDCVMHNSSGGKLGAGVIGIQSVSAADTNTAKANIGGGANMAVCVLKGTDACSATNCALDNSGFVYFSQIGTTITIVAQVFVGINTPSRGFHIHNFGDLSATDGTKTGGHWNPNNQLHGFPGSAEHHLGDLGSIDRFSSSTPVYGIYSNAIMNTDLYWTIDNILGRGIIVHELVDHGNEPTCSGASANGAAGKRVYQCVIGLANPADQGPEYVLPVIDTSQFTFANTWTNIPCSGGGSYYYFSWISFLLFVSLFLF